MRFTKAVLILNIALTSASSASAAVMINEFSSGSSPEWVELYNNSSEPIDLTGWTIKDLAQEPLPLSATISANSYYVFEKSSGWLNDTGDTITLFNNASPAAQIDTISYGANATVGYPSDDKSSGRSPDGSGTWVRNLPQTKNAANPGPTAAPTSGPTNTPSPSNTPVPTQTPVPSATPKPSATPTTPPTATSRPTPTLIALQSIAPETTPAVLGDSVEKPPSNIFPILLIGIGGIGLIISLLLLFKHVRHQN